MGDNKELDLNDNKKTCLKCSYCVPIVYPKEYKKELKCWGKNKLVTISDINSICENYLPK